MGVMRGQNLWDMGVMGGQALCFSIAAFSHLSRLASQLVVGEIGETN